MISPPGLSLSLSLSLSPTPSREQEHDQRRGEQWFASLGRARASTTRVVARARIAAAPRFAGLARIGVTVTVAGVAITVTGITIAIAGITIAITGRRRLGREFIGADIG